MDEVCHERDSIPDEIWIEIFGWLSSWKDRLQARLVCRDWCRLASDALIWRTMDLHNYKFEYSFTDKNIRLSPLLRHVRHMTLTLRNSLVLLRTVCLALNPLLHTLSLVHCKCLTNSVLCELLQKFAATLKSLNITGCNNITDVGIVSLQHNNIALSTLAISGCPLITDLSWLNIFGIDACCANSITDLVLGGVSSVSQSYCAALNTLEFHSSNSIRFADNILSRTSPLSKLTSLTVRGLETFRDVELALMCALAPNIRELKLVGLCLHALAAKSIASLKFLQTLYLIGQILCDAQDCGTILQNCRLLETLILSVARKGKTDDMFCNVNCSLVTFELYGSSVSDRGCQALAKSSPRLQTMTLIDAKTLSDDGVLSVAIHCPKLRTLNLGGCANITDTSICKFRGLHTLDLSNCTHIGDVSMLCLAENCSTLHTLYLENCRLVSDLVFSNKEVFPKLKILAVKGTSLTNKCVASFAYRTCLEDLYYSMSAQVSETFLAAKSSCRLHFES